MEPGFRYDAGADAAYLRLSTEPVAESEEVRPDLILDRDAFGRIVGIEVLRARTNLPADALFGE